nr:tetratricopeptide repeat protein [Propionibacterium sp.]
QRDDRPREGGYQQRDDRPREGGYQQRDERRPYSDRPQRDERRPYSDRPQRDERRPYSDRPQRDDRPREGGYQQRDERRPYSDRPQRDERRPYSDRPQRDERRPYSDRPQRDERRPYGDRPQRDDRPRREGGYQQRDDRPRREGGYQQREDRRPYGDRPQREGGYQQRDDRPRREGSGWRDREERGPLPPGLSPKADEPETPQGLDLKELPRAVRAELRGLSAEQAEIVGAHLLMAGQLIDSDPALAYRHAEAARRRAARLPVTREAAGETAYAAGQYAVALAEFRALRRMTGSDDFVAAMADCERALGNPDKALKLVKEGLKAAPDFTARVELRLVEAGCRLDLDQADEALRVLRQELEAGSGKGSRASRIRLRYGYANILELTGQAEEAERWFAAAAAMDTEGLTDAADRVQALQGLVIEVDEDDLVGEEPEPDTQSEDEEAPSGDEVDADVEVPEEEPEEDEGAGSAESGEDAELDDADVDALEEDERPESAESGEDADEEER